MARISRRPRATYFCQPPMKTLRPLHFSVCIGLIALTQAAHAAPANLDNTRWTPTGTAGLIAGDRTIANSPTGNSQFGYVSTWGEATNVSPLVLKSEGKGAEVATNGAKVVSSAFSASAHDSMTLYFNYLTTDGRGYDDYAWARLVHAGSNTTAAWLFTARSTNSANGNVVPGNVLDRQVDNKLPKNLDATLNDGNTVNFKVQGTEWPPLGSYSGACWDSANTCGPTGWVKSAYTFASGGNYFLEFGVTNWGDQAYDSALAFDFAGLQRANFSALTAPVPEPETYALLLAGLGVLGWGTRRKKTAE